MNPEIMAGLGLLLITYFIILGNKSTTTEIKSDDSNYLINKYGLTENEYRIFTYIGDPVKRDQYLDHVIRSKQKY